MYISLTLEPPRTYLPLSEALRRGHRVDDNPPLTTNASTALEIDGGVERNAPAGHANSGAATSGGRGSYSGLSHGGRKRVRSGDIFMILSRMAKKDFLGKGFVKKSARLSTVFTNGTVI